MTMVFEDLFAAFPQHGLSNPETAVRSLGSSNRLKQEIHWRSAVHRSQLSGDVRQATSLGRNLIGFQQTIERIQNCADRFDRIRGRVRADDGVAAPVEQALEGGEEHSPNIVT